MTLTQQFLIVTIFPLSFLGMIIYLWRSEARRGVTLRLWSLTLILGSVWASSILRVYGGLSFSSWLIFGWGVVGRYALSLMALSVLLATLQFLSISRERGAVAVGISAVLITISLGLDSSLWGTYLPLFRVAGTAVRQFDLWAGIWVASWLVSVLSAWLLTRQVRSRLPLSLYFNQMNYWSLMLTLFAIGGMLASVQQPGRVTWQEAGLLLILPAAFVGTVSIRSSQLPDLQLAVRLLLRRLSGTLIIFGLSWLALWVITEQLDALPVAAHNLLLVAAAALFAGFFTLIYRLVNQATSRLFLPSAWQVAIARTTYRNLLAALPDPEQLANAFLQVLQADLGVKEIWLFVPEDGEDEALVLRPFASKGNTPPQTVQFAADSPFTLYMREQRSLLMQHDIDILRDFRELDSAEREMLEAWQHVLFVPMYVGDRLAGLLALGAKQGGLPYNQTDFSQLRTLAEQAGPLLTQARHMAHLQQVNEQVHQDMQTLALDKRHLQALNQLYARFVEQVSPELKRPFHSINEQIQQARGQLEETQRETLQQQVSEVETTLDRFVQTASRLRGRDQFQFEMVRLDEAARAAQRHLRNMAEARQVHIEFDPVAKTPPVLGDHSQLIEAVQHILHNAIKFNKIGGVINITCGTTSSEVYLRILDTGVGMPPERLENLWTGFPALRPDNSNSNGTRPARLGLTLARFIIDAHGGRIEAESKYGSGSAFSIYLPLQD
ncbi:MAG: GAF domain-containing sensor histidine kinase [Ardenticatenaceae bacterium]|nr:GAF domain-containing sensor histidine kinase [Anaerolineales bacterium]MCB8923308.1 GAF domain-containing sensor histidine kinase [Ardenticatenaceae bacterium]MCB8992048.1 GAF domain-containing sensor histidine kinase [Ardenticatenaceae bacterium]MCB9004693.1 GAF domain-containing sensor histidine kinase [Ardenticatenaceae bacterium]